MLLINFHRWNTLETCSRNSILLLLSSIVLKYFAYFLIMEYVFLQEKWQAAGNLKCRYLLGKNNEIQVLFVVRWSTLKGHTFFLK